jgi:hypothetical protein
MCRVMEGLGGWHSVTGFVSEIVASSAPSPRISAVRVAASIAKPRWTSASFSIAWVK